MSYWDVIIHNYYQVLIGGNIQSYSDYYPFGSLLPNRSGSSGDYRYGFNGMEQDVEVKNNTGNSYDFGGRNIYDGRIGRFFNLDPKAGKFPSMSHYSFAANSPIYFIDRNGESPMIVFQRLAIRAQMLAPYINQGVRTAQLLAMRIGPAASRAIDHYNNSPYAKTLTDRVMSGIADFIIGMGDESLDAPRYINKHFVETHVWNSKYDTRVMYDFGDRSIIRTSYEAINGKISNANVEIHHIIHYDAKDHPIVQHMGDKGFDINNSDMNGIALDKYSPKRELLGDHANHPQYNEYVNRKLDEIWDRKKAGGTEYKWEDVEDDFYELQEHLLDEIEAAEESDKNLNEHFRELNENEDK